MPAGRRELREVYEAKNLAAVAEDLLSSRDSISLALILRWHGMLLALVTSRRVIALADWARACGMSGASATNKARRQTIPAFRMRDRWMIDADFA